MDTGIKSALFFLGGAILLGSVIVSYQLSYIAKKNYVDSAYIGNSIGEIAREINNDYVTVSVTNSLTLEEASTYLRIHQDKLVEIVNRKDSNIPYFKIDNRLYFSKKLLSEWVDDLAANRTSW